jgi:hypothetical protein
MHKGGGICVNPVNPPIALFTGNFHCSKMLQYRHKKYFVRLLLLNAKADITILCLFYAKLGKQ